MIAAWSFRLTLLWLVNGARTSNTVSNSKGLAIRTAQGVDKILESVGLADFVSVIRRTFRRNETARGDSPDPGQQSRVVLMDEPFGAL